MTAATLPSISGRSLLGKFARGLGRTPAMKRKVAAFMKGAREHVPTCASLAAADFGGFTVFHHGGWFVLAGSILLLHYAVAG